MIQRGLIETDWGWFGYLVSDAGLLATVLPGPRGVVEKALARRASGVTRDGRASRATASGVLRIEPRTSVRAEVHEENGADAPRGLKPAASSRRSRITPSVIETESREFERAVRDYFKGRRVAFDVPLDLRAISPFRRRVLVECSKIPWGETCSYADLARAAGSPRATRAAGSAMAHNPMPLVIPCHRVLASNGGIGGFSSTNGVREKIRMLTLEGAWTDGITHTSARPKTRRVRGLQLV